MKNTKFQSFITKPVVHQQLCLQGWIPGLGIAAQFFGAKKAKPTRLNNIGFPKI